MTEFDAGVAGGEPPVDLALVGVGSLRPGGEFCVQGVDVGDAPAEALFGQAGQFDLGDASAGRRSPAGHRKGNKWLCSMLVEGATSAARTKDTYLAARYQRLSRRRGAGKAQLAAAHAMLISAYHILKDDVPYRDLEPDWRKRQTAEFRTKHLVSELEKLGHTVTLETAA